jgi:hypothetical protein
MFHSQLHIRKADLIARKLSTQAVPERSRSVTIPPHPKSMPTMVSCPALLPCLEYTWAALLLIFNMSLALPNHFFLQVALPKWHEPSLSNQGAISVIRRQSHS